MLLESVNIVPDLQEKPRGSVETSEQGLPHLVLEGRFPAEFSSNSNETPEAANKSYTGTSKKKK